MHTVNKGYFLFKFASLVGIIYLLKENPHSCGNGEKENKEAFILAFKTCYGLRAFLLCNSHDRESVIGQHLNPRLRA